jgi:hypothetical protein
MTKRPKQSNAGLKTRHVFLDTEAYRRNGHNLNAKVLQSLLRYIKDDACTLHITDITKSEIKAQIRELAGEIASTVNKGNNKGNKELRRWYSRGIWLPPPKIGKDVDVSDLANRVIADFDITISTAWKVVNHRATDVPSKEIFDLYFRREPPFDTPDSKEFPTRSQWRHSIAGARSNMRRCTSSRKTRRC